MLPERESKLCGPYKSTCISPSLYFAGIIGFYCLNSRIYLLLTHSLQILSKSDLELVISETRKVTLLNSILASISSGLKTLKSL